MKKFLLIVSLFPLLSFAAADAEKINFILGIKLLDSSPSWKIADLHRRTGLPLRGTPGRYSVKMKQPVAGVPAEELIAYTAKNSRMVNRITIVFANKGDTSGKYKSKIKDAGSLLSTRISSAAGNKKRSQFVSGNYRNKADMCGNCSRYSWSHTAHPREVEILSPSRLRNSFAGTLSGRI